MGLQRNKKKIAKQRQLRKSVNIEKNDDKRIIKKAELFNQKEKVKCLVQRARENHEKQLTRKILSDKNRSKKLYTHIKNLKNQEFLPNNPVKIHDENGKVLDEKKIPTEIKRFWEPIYKQHPNKIQERWNETAKIAYKNSFNSTPLAVGTFHQGISIENGIFQPLIHNINIPVQISEHLDCTMPVNSPIPHMKEPKISCEDVENQIKKLKPGKAAGPDSLKPELYKYLVENPRVISTLAKIFNKILETGSIPDDWKTSKTILIEKEKKPMVEDLRPIALTNVSYKILMGIIKDKLFEHLQRSNLINDLQTGATKNRRVTENIHIMQYLIQNSFINKTKLYIFSIDFSKAYDSVNRYKLFQILLEYRVHPKLVDIIAKIYSNDSTCLYLNSKEITNIDISSGIRQGCNLSSLLFILVTYKIIDMMQEFNVGYKDENFNISSLFYMDDGLIFTQSYEYMIKILNGIELNCFQFGLKLNKGKCKVMIINDKFNNDLHMAGFEIKQCIKYLGVRIDNKKKCFETHKRLMFKEGSRLASQTFSILGNCCNRMLIGKTFWKGLALPKILYAHDTIPLQNSDINNLQILDNKSYRYTLGVPKYTANAYLRGEIGTSSSWSRDVKTKLLFVKHALDNNGNNLLSEIIKYELVGAKTDWSKIILKYMRDVGLDLNSINSLSKELIIKKINTIDEQNWKNEMNTKETLRRYRNYKKCFEETTWLRNGFKYELLMRARADVLPLNWRKFHSDSKTCSLCNAEDETLAHF